MSVGQQLSQASTLLGAVDAARNWRALGLMFTTLVAGSVLWGMGALIAGQVHVAVGAIFFLFGLAVVFYGGNAVGIMLMDEARGMPARNPVAALVESLATGHRLVLAFLLFGLIYLAGLLVLAVVLFVCKLPFFGPLLFALVFPVSVVVVGLAIFALQAVVFPLTAPAVWAGATTIQAVSRVGAIARARVVNVVMMMVVLFLITGVVAGLIAAVLFSGTLVTGGLAASILGAPLGFGGGLEGMVSGGSRYMVAGGIGGGVVYAVALSLPALVFARGCCDVYLTNLQGVDPASMEAHMQGRMHTALRKAEELRDRARDARAPKPMPPSPAMVTPVPSPADQVPLAAANLPPAPRAASVAEPAPEPVAPVPPLMPAAPPPVPAPEAIAMPALGVAATPVQCPACSAPHDAGDLFCGNCGFKLKASVPSV